MLSKGRLRARQAQDKVVHGRLVEKREGSEQPDQNWSRRALVTLMASQSPSLLFKDITYKHSYLRR